MTSYPRFVRACAAGLTLLCASCANQRTPGPLTDEELNAQYARDRALVKIRVDSQPTGSIVRINNLRRGMTPVEIVIETNADGSLLSNVDVQIDHSTNPRVAPGQFPASQVATLTYQVGDMIASRIFFNGLEPQESGRAVTLR